MIIHNPILTGSFTVNGTDVASITSSAASITALNAYTASQNILNGTYTLTSSFAAQTASFTAFTASVNSFTASQLVLNGTYATTGSNTFAGIQTVNSNLVVTGSITAQTLVVQTITSSVDFVTGSTRFGSLSSNTHIITGSMYVTGAFYVTTGSVGIGTSTPDIFGRGYTGTTVGVSAATGDTGLEINGGTSSGAYIDLGNAGTRRMGIISTATDSQIISLSTLPLVFKTNSTTALTINSSQVATFSSSVQVTGYSAPTSGAGLELFYTGGEARLFGYDRTNSVYKPMGFGVGGVQLYLPINGYVGIGTSIPLSKLTVWIPTIQSNAGVWSNCEIAMHNSTSVGDYSQIGLGYAVGTTNAAAYIGLKSTSATANGKGDLVFGTRDVTTDTAPTERMRITSGGNVGIATSSPESFGAFAVRKSVSLNSKNVSVSFSDATNSTFDVRHPAASIVDLSSQNSALTFSTSPTDSNGIERMRISTAGNVSVNSGTSAAPELSVRGTTGSNSVGGSARLAIYDDATANVRSWIFQIDGSSQLRTFYYNGTSWATNGYQTTGGTWTNSDERRKTNIENLEYGLNEILQLTPKKFNFKHDIEGGNIRQKDMGFIAQEVLPIMPLAVDAYIDGEEEYYSMNYANIVPVLVKAIQELKTQNDDLQSQITELKNK